jgi:hypothetical protein
MTPTLKELDQPKDVLAPILSSIILSVSKSLWKGTPGTPQRTSRTFLVSRLVFVLSESR